MQDEREFGRLNPKAPSELERFAFLIGRWDCQAKLKSSDGSWQIFDVRWTGRYVLDGYAIADEYHMTGSNGELIVLGINFRTFNPAKRAWHIKWLNALSGEWTDLVSGQLGGIKITKQAISYSFSEPNAPQKYTKATYTNFSKQHFTWIGQQSEDGKSWADFMVVDCGLTKTDDPR
jgi:hypothetical protein